MEEITFKDWRLTGFWVAMTACGLITGFVFGWAWRDRPGALADVSILSAMTAVGTIGSAAGAVGIAYWQNWDRRKEQHLNAAVRDWSNAHAAYRISGRLNQLLTQWMAVGRPSSSEFSALHLRLASLHGRVEQPGGGSIVSDLEAIASSLEGACKSAEEGARIRAARATHSPNQAMFVKGMSDDDLSAQLARVNSASRRCESWMLGILADAKRTDVDIPGVVSSSSGHMGVKVELHGKSVSDTADF